LQGIFNNVYDSESSEEDEGSDEEFVFNAPTTEKFGKFGKKKEKWVKEKIEKNG